MENEVFVEQVECGPMQNFVYLVGSRATREVALVDPAWEIDRLLDRVEELGMTPVGALVTHYHPDHVGGKIFGREIPGLPELLARRGMKVYAQGAEADGIRRVTGISESDLVRVSPDDTLSIGGVEVRFLHTPGHTPGSQCFLVQNALVSGDTLFIRGCGRVDLPGSNPDEMYTSLRRLASLPDDVVLLPGHNYADVAQSTLAAEKRHNPYLRIPTREMWREMMGQ